MSATVNLCVVIPVHQAAPSANELISLKAAADQLNAYDCYLVYPQGMPAGAYSAVFPQLKLLPVNPRWLSSIAHYNKMKLDPVFYRLFGNYQYMLTYELDAYIFHADFLQTGALAFDFIGAPFFDGYWGAEAGAPFIKGCNSGFSIRNVQSCLKVLREMDRFKLRWWLFKLFLSYSSKLRVTLNKLTRGKYDVYLSGKFGFYFADFHLNEDSVWTEVVPQLFPWFKIADPLSALKFSFEYNLPDSLRLNNGNLPLGCHAWHKHPDFWKAYIHTEGPLQ